MSPSDGAPAAGPRTPETLRQALALTPIEASFGADAAWRAELGTGWLQGRTVFGGLVAGIAATAAARVAGPDRPVRSLDVAFVGPLTPGPVDVVARVLNAGKAVTQVSVDVVRDGVLTTRVHAVAGTPRTTVRPIPGAGPTRQGAEHADPATAGDEMPYIEGLTPTFLQNLDLRWCGPAWPFSASPLDHARLEGWSRWRTPGDAPDGEDDAARLGALVAMLDAWPPAVLTIAAAPSPASTIRWSIHLLATPPVDAASRWYWYECDTVAYADGYATTTDTFFVDGAPVAWTEQLIAMYERSAPPA